LTVAEAGYQVGRQERSHKPPLPLARKGAQGAREAPKSAEENRRPKAPAGALSIHADDPATAAASRDGSHDGPRSRAGRGRTPVDQEAGSQAPDRFVISAPPSLKVRRGSRTGIAPLRLCRIAARGAEAAGSHCCEPALAIGPSAGF
jgi:hypothetical protein